MGKVSRAASHLPYNYPQLQNLIKRDPESYREEFLQQYQHFKSSLAILEVQPDAVEDHFEALVMFISHVASCYKEESREFPETIIGLLERDAVSLPSSFRRCLVQCLLLVRKTKLISLERVLILFFRLFRVIDKQLRDMLYDAIVGEIKRANTPHRNNALNKNLQALLFKELHQQSVSNAGHLARNDSAEAIASHKALQVMIELYRRGIWNDGRTVNVVAEACTAQISYKVTVTGLNFFLGRCKRKSGLKLGDESESDSDGEEEEDEAEAGQKLPSLKEVMYKMQVSGKTKAKKTKLKKFKAQLKRQEADKQSNKGSSESAASTFPAIHMLNDPYGFVERLFGILKKSTDTFEFKLLLINVISRVIGAHKLIFLDLYSFLLRYIQPHQKNVTQVLAYTAQSSHELVPPDVIVPVVKAIANNFVADHCRNEVIAAGLNGLTAICSRCPLAMDSTLLQDLANYKGYNDKSVMMAARSLISLYREKNPELLHRRDRGKDASMAMQRGQFAGPKAYGQLDVAQDIQGAELLHSEDGCEGEDGSEGDEDEGEDDGEDDGEGWVDVSEDGSDIELEDEEGDEDDGEDNSEEDSEEDSSASSEEEQSSSRKEVNNIMSIAQTRLLTPRDFALLKRKRLEAAVEASSGAVKHHPNAKKARKAAADALDAGSDDDEDGGFDEDEADGGRSEVVRPSDIASLSRKPKADYAARMESIKAGREGRQFGSRKGKDSRGSRTNAEKSKCKNQVMMAHKFGVRQKKQRSFREVQEVKAAHTKRQKLKRK